MGDQIILYVEDLSLNVQLLRKMLKFMPYQILDAATGASGIQMAQTHAPDLILMDITLPDMSGLDVTSLIKTYDTLRHIPIVAFTADTSQEIYEQCLKVGCSAYLNKPISKAHLLRVIHQVLSGSYNQAAESRQS